MKWKISCAGLISSRALLITFLQTLSRFPLSLHILIHFGLIWISDSFSSIPFTQFPFHLYPIHPFGVQPAAPFALPLQDSLPHIFCIECRTLHIKPGEKWCLWKGFNTWTIFSWNFSSTFWVYRVTNYFYRGWIIRLPREYQGSFANFIGGWSSPFSKLAFFSSLPILKQQALCSSIMSSDHPVYSIRRSKPSNPRVMSCTSCTKFFSIRNLPDDKFRWSPRKCDQWFSSLSTPSSFRQPLSCHFISDFLVSGFRFAACPWPSWLCLSVESIGFCFSFQTTINLQAFVSIDRNMPTLGRSREIRAGWEEKTIETDTLRYFHS